MPKMWTMQRLDPDCETKVVTFRLPADDFARLVKAAKRDALQPSVWVRALVQQALDNRTRKP